jgi:hypothetical protein
MALAQALIERGYFPVEIPPALSPAPYSKMLRRLPGGLGGVGPDYSRCAFHSIPRLQHSRRLLAIPNPLHQYKLALVIEKAWPALDAHMKRSPLSLTRLEVKDGSSRALSRVSDFADLDEARLLASSSSRFVLKADISRFYHTLYTHSISWALHTKDVAKLRRNDRRLVGNLLDEAVRQTQDQQTLGIPVGPNTSDLISELLGVALDLKLLETNPQLERAGFRYVDDYYLYFATRHGAESVLADLHKAASYFAVEINPLKTSIRELPEGFQPEWKSTVRSHEIRVEQERSDLLSLFSAAYENAAKYPGNNVLKYVVKQSTSHTVSHDNWKLYEAFLLGALVSEPGLAPTLAPILVKYRDDGYCFNGDKLQTLLAEMAFYHARLRQGFEVAWALWLCKLLSVSLPNEVVKEISQMDDSIVALLALDLRSGGFADALNTEAWSKYMQADHLYSEYWLLAYEALVKGWLGPLDGHNYVADDGFFGILAQSAVEFYDTGTTQAASDTDWLSAYV